MNERIRELAITGGIYDCLCDPYDKFKTGDHYGSVMYDLERFAEKIVRECALTAGLMEQQGRKNIGAQLLDNFGVKE